VKKQNIRVRRQGGSKAVSLQVAKTTEPAQGKAQPNGKVDIDTWDPNGAALVFMIGSVAGPEEEIAGLNFSQAEFALIQRAAKAGKLPLDVFLNNVLSDGCKRILGEALPPLSVKGGVK